MSLPITSEITLGIGTILREISTGQLFTVAERLENNSNVLGDTWKLTPMIDADPQRLPIVMTRQELSEKYFVEEDGD
jgi:hypothetical protein